MKEEGSDDGRRDGMGGRMEEIGFIKVDLHEC